LSLNGFDFEALFDAVRSCDLRETLNRRGYQFQRDGFFQSNPLRDERTSSIHVRSDDRSRWHDFGSSTGGDLVDFLQQAESLSLEEARAAAAELLGVRGSGSTAGSRTRGSASQKVHIRKSAGGERREVDLEPVARQAHEALWRGESSEAKRALAYLRERGFAADSAALRASRVGVIDASVELPLEAMRREVWNGRITFPYQDGDRVPFLNGRAAASVATTERYRKPTAVEQVVPFTIGSLAGSSVVLVEGELDALAVREALGDEVAVLATGGGGLRDRDVPLLREAREAFLLFDADETGSTFTTGARKALEALGMNVGSLTLKDGSKDASEALVASGRQAFREELMRQIQEARSARGTGDALYLRTTFLEELERRHARPYAAFSTFIPALDALLDGGYQEGLHVLGGLTAGGKTSFAVRLALENASVGRSVIYATFEQSKVELWSRLVSAATSLPYRALKRGTYEERGERFSAAAVLQAHKDWSRVLQAGERLHVLEAGDAFSNRSSASSVEAIHALAGRLRTETGVPPLVIVDYLQRVPVPALANKDVRERVDHVVGLLQVGIAREIGSPVLALSSLNRSGYGKNGEKATIEDKLGALKESGGIEFTAYSVALLYPYRDGAEPTGFVPSRMDRWKPLCFDLIKNREGSIGEVPMRWTPIGDSWGSDGTLARRP
jgi:replicative DNA helicase